MWHEYPYTDSHELNLDWFLKEFKTLVETWEQVQSEWNSLHDFVQNYFDNLNVQSEINNKINAMIADGSFALILTPLVEAALPTIVDGKLPAVVASQIGAVVAAQIGAVVAGQLPAVAAQAAADEVSNWLAAHIDPDTGYVIDNTLTISQAAADALTTGEYIKENTNSIIRSNNGLDSLLTYSHFLRGDMYSGVYSHDKDYRIVSENIMTFDHRIDATIAPGFRVRVAIFLNGVYQNTTDYLTGSFYLNAGSTVKMAIARETEDVSEVADIIEFTNAIIFNSQIENRIEELSQPGTSLKMVGCVLRNTGTGWNFITTDNHLPLNMSSVTVDASGNIVVNYSFTATNVISLVVTPDETFAGTYLVGASVALDKATITIYDRATGLKVNASDVISPTGNFWVYGVMDVS